METNYELKHKCLLVPLKAVLLVIAMVLVGFTTYAQQGKSIKVANDRQLIEAMENPSIGTIELAPGYYAYLNINAFAGTRIIKRINGDGSRSSSGCTYYIRGDNYCFDPNSSPEIQVDPPAFPPTLMSFPGFGGSGDAQAGVDNATCNNAPILCCPTNFSGRWTCTLKPPTAAWPIYYDTANYLMPFLVNQPGQYKFKYIWDPAKNPALSEYAEVETEYNFYGPLSLEMDAPDVCGTTTYIDFTYQRGYPPAPAPDGTISWTIDYYPYGNPQTLTGMPTATINDFAFTAACCGKAIISVTYTYPKNDYEDCVATVSDTVEFSCDPIADAGDDAYVCYDNCYTLHGNTGLGIYGCSGYTFSDNYAYTFVQLNGPSQLQGLPAGDNAQVFDFETQVCRDERSDQGGDMVCPYGVYEIEFQVTNGECYDADTMLLTFYEMPEANAGADQYYCADACFSLAAVPYSYCGVEGVNYYKHAWWTLETETDCDVTFDPLNPTTNVCITDCECPNGIYTFVWHELNVKVVNGDTLWAETMCYATDTVQITIFEDLDPDAGDEAEYCETDIDNGQGWLEFYLNGAFDAPCNQDLYYTFNWSVLQKPGDCEVNIQPNNIDPLVSIDKNCTNCKYGEYIFRLRLQTGYFNANREFVAVCDNYEDVSVWIYQQPEIISIGADQSFCNTYTFDLTAEGSDYDCHQSNWYSWTLFSQPADAGCEVVITNGTTENASVVIQNCTGTCPYGEFVFKFAEYNGSADVYCYDEAFTKVTIYEQPTADAGDDYWACVEAANAPYTFEMSANMDYCYTMYGKWSKLCGPGQVVFDDIYDTNTMVTFPAPGRYIFQWKLWNEECSDSATVLIDLLEQPFADGDTNKLIADCDSLCDDLGRAGIIKYKYIGTDQGTCPNYWDKSHWSYVAGPTMNPAEVTFADEFDPTSEICVDDFGCYTVRWNEINKPDDKTYSCESYYDVFLLFVETPDPDAGPNDSICGECYTMKAEPFTVNNCSPAESSAYWELIDYIPPVDPCPTDNFAIEYSACLEEFDIEDPAAEICVCDDCLGSHYGKYIFRWVEASGYCIGYDTVEITFKKAPEKVALEGMFDPSNSCYESFYGPAREGLPGDCPWCYKDCVWPEDTPISVCAESCLNWSIDWDCFCAPGPIPGYTYEWSFIGPAGSTMEAEPYWYDCAAGCWRGDDYVHICFGECCDTARLYLTITAPNGCTTTEEWKFYVEHKPCANIEGPEISQVYDVVTYCNVCPPEFDQSCLLYTWTAEHCGIIQDGQGTECIDVLWTNYNVNGGWGEITLTVFDTCTGCCNYDEMMVKIYPAGTLGNGTLSGQVLYHNDGETPLNGVTVYLKKDGITLFETESFIWNEEIDTLTTIVHPGYYKFTGISETTEFDIEASYDAPWYGANATDALAVELKVINNFPLLWDAIVGEAMDVNFNQSITATDALWIKQRAINMVNYFPAGNWVFDPEMSSDTGTYNIYTLNAGDANRSNIPNSQKSAPAVELLTNGTMNVVAGQEFELPIRIDKSNQFGAIQLNLEYNPSLVDVLEVAPVEGMIYNISNGNVNIAYSNLNAMTLADNDVVFTLKAKVLGEVSASEPMFRIGMNTQFADAQAKVIEPVSLKTFGITTDPAAADYFLSTNRPNPFSTSTFIEYTMPESGKVKLSVLDMLGQEIAVLVDATQTAGSYTVEFSAAGLATGVYLYKISVDGETRDYISTQRMVISH